MVAGGSEYHVKIIIDSKDQTSGPATKAAKGMTNLKQAAKLAAGAFVAFKAAQKGIEFVKFGASVQRAASSLNALAKGAGHSGDEIVKSIQVASDFTIDKMTAMESANKAMLLGVAESPEEFARLAEYATKLGRAMGQDAAKSIDDFVTAAGRQSKMIADNLGLMISAEDANKRYAETNGIAAASMTDQQKKAAFLQEMLRQAEEKTVALGDANLTAADKMDIANAAFADAKSAAASLAATIASKSGVIEGFSKWARETATLIELIDEHGFSILAWLKGVDAYVLGGRDAEAAAKAYTEEQELQNAAIDDGKDALAQALPRYESYEIHQNAIEQAAYRAAAATRQWQGDEENLRAELEKIRARKDVGDAANRASVMLALNRAEQDAELELAAAIVRLRREGTIAREDQLDEYLKQVEKTKQATAEEIAAEMNFRTRAAIDYTSFVAGQRETAEDFADDAEGIEAEHQANLTKIAKKGQATRIKFDEAESWDKLARLETRLDIELERQSEFNDKTKNSQRMAKTLAIETLQGQIADTTKELDDFYAGRLWRAGMNTDALLAEEKARHDEQLAMLNQARFDQEEADRQSLGRMVIENWKAWAAINKVAVEKIGEVERELAVKYGLMTEEGKEWVDEAESNFGIYSTAGVKAADAIKIAIDSIPRTVDVDINFQYREAGKEAAIAEYGYAVPGMPGAAAGGYMRGSFITGEGGPEMVTAPGGAYVHNAQQTSNITNFNQTVNTRATQANVMGDFAYAQAMAG